jgi:hypothetical protein
MRFNSEWRSHTCPISFLRLDAACITISPDLAELLSLVSNLTIVQRRAKPQRESFKKFLGLFAKHSKDKEINRFDIGRKFRWEDVQSEANAALEAYTNQVTFRSQPVRYLSRSFTQSASTLEAFLQFVPDGEFTFIICGALTLVFRVNTIFIPICQ